MFRLLVENNIRCFTECSSTAVGIGSFHVQDYQLTTSQYSSHYPPWKARIFYNGIVSAEYPMFNGDTSLKVSYDYNKRFHHCNFRKTFKITVILYSNFH